MSVVSKKTDTNIKRCYVNLLTPYYFCFLRFVDVSINRAMLNTNTISNTELIDLWLHGKSTNTVDGYRRYAERFFASVGNKPLGE
ncbi:MAG: hypothetical protein AAF757_30700, partial [Cyanobacteria bacterium P01_D01_bin.116]